MASSFNFADLINQAGNLGRKADSVAAAAKTGDLVDVELRTRWLPTVSSKPLAPGPSSSPSWLLTLLQPRLVVSSPLGTLDRAPWGDPGESRWPLVALVLAAAAIGVGYLAYKGARTL
jgi:hypothetical protein